MTSVKMTSAPLDLGEDLWVASSFRATTAIDDSAATVDLDVMFNQEAGRYQVDQVTVHRGGTDAEEITGAVLREIRLQETVQKAGLGVVWFANPQQGMIANMWGLNFMRRIEPIDGRTQPEHVGTAARIYRIASIVGLPPLRTVAEKLGVSQSTATRLISKARELGHVLSARAPGVTAVSAQDHSAFESLTIPSGHDLPDVWVELLTDREGAVTVTVNGRPIEGSFASREAALEAIRAGQEKFILVYGEQPVSIGTSHGND
ncbi:MULTISPECIES: hypothetical protein [Microbacterium]|uniref:hypothetical protein n=1 Tax=Microbacterium TaxID=33882 RepID=UPI0028E50A33|nr:MULTISPECIES: hypothetical protein [Microbacterium]